jgi:hypothetical protein
VSNVMSSAKCTSPLTKSRPSGLVRS